MSPNNFFSLESSEKEIIFQEISNDLGMPVFSVEKDWWVSQTLAIIFSMNDARHMVFKGGTSLSKAWKLIYRLSEDIDLAVDREFLGFSGELTKRGITELRKAAGAYSTGSFFSELKKCFQERGLDTVQFRVVETTESDKDPRVIEIYYPNVIHPASHYLLPRVQIEIGCRSLREPFSYATIGSFVDEAFPDQPFSSALFQVATVNPERTFLEKLFLLHEEFHRHTERMRVDRLSRHLYDIYYLTKSGVGLKALKDKELYEAIVSHRHKFSRVGGVDYNSLNPLTLNPKPLPSVVESWKTDCSRMLQDMICEPNPPSFEHLIANLNDLMLMLQSIEWRFELVFPHGFTGQAR